MSTTFPSSWAYLRWFLLATLVLAALSGGYWLSQNRQHAADQAALQAALQVDDSTVQRALREMVMALWRLEVESHYPFSPAQARLLLPAVKKAEWPERLSKEECNQLLGEMHRPVSEVQGRILKAINMGGLASREESGLKEAGGPEGKGTEGTKALSPETSSYADLWADLIKHLEKKATAEK